MHVRETCASHDQATCHLLLAGAGGVIAFSDFGFAVGGVLDRSPCVIGDRCDGVVNAFAGATHSHRVAHVQPVQHGDRVVGPEPGIEPDRQRSGRIGAADTGDEFVDEPSGPALGVRRSFPHPSVQHLAGVGARREERVISELAGVAVSGALFVFADDLTDRRVDVDYQRPGRSNTHRPGSFECAAVDGFELANVSERERPEDVPSVEGAITR